MNMRISRIGLNTISRLLSTDSGQDLAEYGLALAVIGAVGATVATLISVNVGALWTNAQSVIQTFP